jgi:hypothetical protein
MSAICHESANSQQTPARGRGYGLFIIFILEGTALTNICFLVLSYSSLAERERLGFYAVFPRLSKIRMATVALTLGLWS